MPTTWGDGVIASTAKTCGRHTHMTMIIFLQQQNVLSIAPRHLVQPYCK